ncbi:MAG: acyl carrier protein, partial [Okeania sp. SIO2H7]|nr:acyl carrier protein [Okeania sp. SIO2H7]
LYREYGGILEKLQQAASFKEKLELLKSHFQLQVALVMGLDTSELPETTRGFAEMGMDSLMAVDLKKRLETSLAIPLSPTLAFNYPNIEALSEYIITEFFEENKREPQPDNLVADIAEIQGLSEEEIAASLEREIAALEKMLLISINN